MCSGDFQGVGGAQAASGARVQAVGTLANGLGGFVYNRQQATQAGADARAELDAAQAVADKTRRATRSAVGATRADLVGAGVKVSSDSAMALEEDINQRGESDALTAILTGQRKADNQRRLASQYRTAALGGLSGSLLRAQAGYTDALSKWRGIKRQPDDGPSGNLDFGNPNERGDY